LKDQSREKPRGRGDPYTLQRLQWITQQKQQQQQQQQKRTANADASSLSTVGGWM